jgi:hypothetical protein
MEASMTTRLSDIVGGLDAYVRHVRKLGLKQSALLLEMAKLDLQMRIHDITEPELDALCRAIERQDEEASRAAISPAPPQVSETTTSTVVPLFGADRFPENARHVSKKPIPDAPLSGERRVRGKTLVPR